MSKEKRRFKRYTAESDFNIVLEGNTYHAVTQDYSVDGLSAYIDGVAPIKVGDILELNIPKLGIRTLAKVVRAVQHTVVTVTISRNRRIVPSP